MSKEHKLIFIRHGIRGLSLLETTTEHCVPYFAPSNNLSLYGYLYSYKLGAFIKNRYGEPSLIYPNNDSERTISTGIAIAKGCGSKEIKFSKQVKDPYYMNNYKFTADDIEKSRELLKNKQTEIEKIKVVIVKCLPCIKLSNDTEITDKGTIIGLLKELNILINVPSFSKLSNSNIHIDCDNKLIESAFNIKHDILFLPDIVTQLGMKLIGGIHYLLQKEKLSVLIGHGDNNLAIIGRFLDKTFNAPHYAKGYIPANSGYIFTLKDEHIDINIIYLDTGGEFNICAFLKIPIPNLIYIIPTLVTKVL